MSDSDLRKPIVLMLEELSDRLLRMYPDEIRECLASLDDERIWWRPNEASMSVGNMVLHLTGNLNHYLGRGVVASGYRRERPKEFSEQGPIPRQELLRRFEEALGWARKAFERMTPETMLETAELGEESVELARLAVSVTTHFNGHVGQIIYVTKMVKGKDFADELWRRVRDH
ncbi:MAG TPA: DUF1572 family protein [Candidatus Eisenbacteria bacterium]|nr:DUF1572 family protein [Candidatus Eisenbacteria bacterium]